MGALGTIFKDFGKVTGGRIEMIQSRDLKIRGDLQSFMLQ